MGHCLFVSDLHGDAHRYETLFEVIVSEHPGAVFIAGDLLPGGFSLTRMPDESSADFVHEALATGFRRVRDRLGSGYPEVYLILGNDDPRIEEMAVEEFASSGLWHYAHSRRVAFGRYPVYGYAFVPPSPFQLKDWERYDVSRYVDPGCVSPEEGMRTVPVPESEARYATMAEDLDRLIDADSVNEAIFLSHSPPYDTKLDRAALDGKMIDHVPLDVHVGSIAIRQMIEQRQPLLTLHGHIHESARLTGAWRDQIGRTHMFTAAHDGPELALVRFDLADLEDATRELI
jgi:Icc-related predicted phosphoesterase